MKKIVKKYFQYLYYFYSYLGNRLVLSFTLSVLVGVMDGLGLAMFIPLLQMIDEAGAAAGHSESNGNLSFLPGLLGAAGLPLNLIVVLSFMLFFFSMKGLMKFGEAYARVVYEQYFIRKIRMGNILGLSNFSFNEFINADIGRIQNTFSGEVEKIKQAYRYYFIALQYSIFVAVYVTMAFFSSPKFVLLVIAGGAATNFLFRFLQKKTKALSHKITIDNHAFQGLLIQKVAFFKYLKSTGLIHRYAQKLIDVNDKLHDAQRKSGFYGAVLAAVREPVVILVVVLAILTQVYYFHQGIAMIILTLLFFYRALISLTGMQNYANLFISSAGSLENMTAFNKELRDGRDFTGSKPFSRFENKVSLQSLSFAFKEQKILTDISFEFEKNKTIAIVGESGSGKTTLVNLLTGLLKPTSGKLNIDDTDLNEYEITTFQNRIGYITQEPVIFNDSVFNNVTFWDQPTKENIERFEIALRKASIYDFVMSQPMKKDALLGNNGINVSGGQKQRISIARELYKDVDFLIMDEATSALDSETENEIQENIEQLKGKYTILIIAHRLSTIKNTDHILLLNKGRISAAGNFETLLNSSELFNKMVQLQGI